MAFVGDLSPKMFRFGPKITKDYNTRLSPFSIITDIHMHDCS